MTIVSIKKGADIRAPFRLMRPCQGTSLYQKNFRVYKIKFFANSLIL